MRRGDAWDEAVFRDEQVIVSLVMPGLPSKVAELWLDLAAADDEVDEAQSSGA
jgi:hypothetical protein